jgi:hypothetical protein
MPHVAAGSDREATKTGAAGESATLRVATIPYDHPYLEAVRPAVTRVGPAPAADHPWAPSPWLQPAYLQAHAHEVDVLHVHFGFDGLSGAEMQAWTKAVRRSRIPLVVTVHDLRNPHHPTRRRHDAHLAALLATAATVLTLTDSAAAEIKARFGRTATVVAHPGLVVPLPGVVRRPGLIGLHLKALRTNVLEPMALVRTAAAAATEAGGRLRVDVHHTLDLPARLPGLRELAAAGALDLAVHPRFDDDELVRYLQTLSVSLLPYRFGTHSGWLEACRDVGTTVIAPDCGHFADQWSEVVSYHNNEKDGLDHTSLVRAVRQALARPQPAPADPVWRRNQLSTVRAQHAELYAELPTVGSAAGRSVGASPTRV